MTKTRIYKTLRGIYEIAEWNGKNESGLKPFGDKVLIMPDQPAMKSAGGIITGSDEEREKVAYAAEMGVMIAFGEDAFVWNSDRSRRLEGGKPPIGTRVCFKRYSGETYTGDDDKFYMVMSDHAIGAIKA